MSHDAVKDCLGQLRANLTLQLKLTVGIETNKGYGRVALCRLTMLHDAGFLPRPIAVFLYPSFVVLPLSFGQPDFYLGPASRPIHGRWDQCIALAFDRPEQADQLAAVQQQLACARGIGRDVPGRRWQGVDQAAEQEGLIVLEQHVAVRELYSSFPQRFDLPTLERDSSLESFLDVVFEACPLVERDGLFALIS